MIDLAYNMALKSTSRFRLGAVLVKRRKVISTGFNQMKKTHPLMQRHNPRKDILLGLHAEIHSCIGVPAAQLESADVWVARVYANGRLAMAMPCKVCQNFLREVGVKNVYYSTGTGKNSMGIGVLQLDHESRRS